MNNNNNFGNKPQFGNSPFGNNNGNALSTRSSLNNFRPAYGSFGSSYGRPSQFGSSYGRPSQFGSSYGRPMSFGSSYGQGGQGNFGSYARPFSSPYGGMGSSRPAFGGFAGNQNPMYRPSYMSTRPPFGSMYANRFEPMSGSRYGYDSLPPFAAGNPNAGQPQHDPNNKYNLDNAQPQGVDVNNNFEQVPQEQNAQYYDPNQQPVADAQYYDPNQQPVADAQYDPNQQPVAEAEPVAAEAQEYVEQAVAYGTGFDPEFLKGWEPSLKQMSELSSYGMNQRGSYIVDDAGNVIGDGYEGMQEDPNNPGAEVYEYSSEINAINSSYSYGKEGEIYGANVITSEIPTEDTASYLTQMGIKAIYYLVKGEKAVKKSVKNKAHKKLVTILEPAGCSLTAFSA